MQASALRLSMRRVGGTLGGRLGWLGAIVVAVAFSAAAASGDDVVGDAVRVLCWIAAGPAALAASRAPALRDRSDGIELLASLKGIGPARWRRTRVAAAASSCALRVVIPAIAVAATAVVVSPTLPVFSRAGGALFGAAAAGAVIGLVAAVCGEAGGERGRTLFAAVVLLPWMLGDLWSVPSLSLVGVIDAGLDVVTEVPVWW
jgi:hypothetical protein